MTPTSLGAGVAPCAGKIIIKIIIVSLK